CGYWQSVHRLRTSAGYSGFPNLRFDLELVEKSPFAVEDLLEPEFLKGPDGTRVGVSTGVDFKDYVWLYLTVHRLGYVFVHQWEGVAPGMTTALGRIKDRLAEAKIFEDSATAVYARARITPPKHPVWVATAGWPRRASWPDHMTHALVKTGLLSV